MTPHVQSGTARALAATMATVVRPGDVQTWPPNGSAPAPDPDRAHIGGLHWESWALRALLAGVLAFQFATGNAAGAVVAGIGLALSLVPLAITRFSHFHVPRLLDSAFTLAVALQFVSESFKLFELFTYWDKLVHSAEIFLAAAVAAFLVFGYRDLNHLRVPDQACAASAMLFGMTLGSVWEVIEFAFDWFGNAHLQKSNADTMTDFLWNAAGAVFGALLGAWLYCHRTDAAQRQKLGRIADWLTNWLAGQLTRRGKVVGFALAVVFVAVIAAGWYVNRASLPPPSGAPGDSQSWSFPADVPAAQVVAGHWVPADSGLCRVNADTPRPGSEQPGLVRLQSDAAYGQTRFAFAARDWVERPALGQGTMMEAGIAFGIRDPENFYLLRQSVLHDVVVLERYVDGRKYDMVEEHVITRANSDHTLGVEVDGDRVRALFDGVPLFETGGVQDTTGGIGLWSRVTASGCFQSATVTVA